MTFSLRNRIAFYYIAATAALVAVLFFAIYLTVFDTVYSHLNDDLNAETSEVSSNIVVLNDKFIFANPYEWEEKEHAQIEVNPTFIQVMDTLGNIIKKTPNLINSKLDFNTSIKNNSYYNSKLSGSPVRQLKSAIKNPNGKILGYLLIAVPLEESEIVLTNLKYTLIAGYPVVLMILFFISRFIAGKSIAPINKVIKTAGRITNENLDERIELPSHKDEIHQLTLTINQLLDRLEDVVLREKQFTADASHELRTPLAVIKGTLEVLTRKPREAGYYEEKIKYVISEVDRMTLLVDQLLELSRYESGKITPNFSTFELSEIVDEIFNRLKLNIESKKLTIKLNDGDNVKISSDKSMVEIILENLISNSIKYSESSRAIEIDIKREETQVQCKITDHGSGIPANQLDNIFDRFYRVDESRNASVSGKGLGLAIVKKLTDLLNIELQVESKVGEGTSFTLIFPK